MLEPITAPQASTDGCWELIRHVGGDRAQAVQVEYLKSYVLRQLPEELSIIVDFHIRACSSCSSQLQVVRAAIDRETAGSGEQRRLYVERRKSVRVLTDNPAVVTVLRPEPSSHKNSRILDASREGMKLLVPCQMMMGAVVQVHVCHLFILAEVRYCRPVGEAFHAGVLIQDVFEAPGGRGG